jgi:hypothetical protein
MSLEIRVEERGIEEAKQRLSELMRRFSKDVAAGMKEEAESIMTESKLEVPVDTGALRSSGFVEEPQVSTDRISVKLGYGGAATKINPVSGQLTTSYAIIVHEGYQHHTVGKRKYLEDPVKRRRSTMWTAIYLSVRRALSRSGIK